MYQIRNDLHLSICHHCGKALHPGRGIYERIRHDSNVTIYTGRMGMQALLSAIAGQDILHSFRVLEIFPYLLPMPGVATASEADKRIYSLCRDMEIRQMLRMREYMEAERRLANKL